MSYCRGHNRDGQTLIFLIVILVILVFVVLWNFDLHRILHAKSRAQDAGDSAALVAARWQGLTLNLIGDLNIMQAVALSTGNDEIAGAITNVQARLCFVGPMVAFLASQQAAKNNGVYVNQSYTRYILDHAETVRSEYPFLVDSGGEMLFPEPYPGCWEEYADMLEYIGNQGIAAGPDNARFYIDNAGDHVLLNIEFYEAIAGQFWCWFYFYAPDLLEEYHNFFPCWWPALPETVHARPTDSEIFGLGLRPLVTTLRDIGAYEAITNAAGDRGFSPLPDTNSLDTVIAWYTYDPEIWRPWEEMSVTGADPFPAAGPIRPEADYLGADAAVRIELGITRMTPAPRGPTATNAIVWSAAAKSFGTLEGDLPPNAATLVLPAFREVRLIPVDASSAPVAGRFNLEWRTHVEEHLPEYMENGPGESSCWYCRQLVLWEDPEFRQSGVDWLDENSHLCTLPGGPGEHPGGGRRRGH